MKSQLDIIVFKRNSFDSESLMDRVAEFTDNFMFIEFDSKGVHGFFKFLRFPGKLYYWLYPLAFLYDNYMIFCMFLTICLRYKVNTLHIDTYSACFLGILKKLGLCKKIVYVTTDWFVTDPHKGIWNKIGVRVFRFLDKMAVNSADVVLNYTQRQTYMRKMYSRKEVLFHPRLKLKMIPISPRHTPVFIGEVRKDSGLHLVPDVRIIKFKDRDELPELLKDALCGINLITQPNSCTKYTVSSKIMDYFQHGLPVIVTDNVGDIVNDIKMFKLGYVVEPYPQHVRDAVRNCYLNQRSLTENVVKYVTERQYTRLQDVWKA